MIPIAFTKATGAGNDFVVIDGFEAPQEADPGALARALCDRHFGVGADGLLILLPHAEADFEMRYYNADGSTGGMCGNGGRCAALYAFERGHAGERLRFHALGHIYEAEVRADRVRLSMKDPRLLRAELKLRIDDVTHSGYLLDTGSPHLVVFTGELEAVDVVTLGRALRHHPELAPDGANVNFVAFGADGSITIRTYERGVEGETLACGTGSVACAAAATMLGRVHSPVSVRVRSGEFLNIELERSPEGFSSVVLEGPARLLFSGSCLYDPLRGIIMAHTAAE